MASSQLGLATALVVLAGCAAEGAEDLPDDADAKRVAYGVVAVERTEGEGLSRASVSAKFMRVSAREQLLAEDLVAARPVVPAKGECSTLATLEDLSVARFSSGDWQSFAIELLDVGDVSLLFHPLPAAEMPQAAAETLLVPLSPRAFPDVGDLASGVFYTTPDATLPLSSEPFELAGSGAAAVDAFVLDVGSMPEHPADLRIGNLAADEEDVIEVSADADLALSWRPSVSPEAERDGDLFYVDVLGSSAYRCAFADGGAAVLPRGVLSEGDAGGEATISLHRVTERVVPLRSGDLAAGEARIHFDVASAVRVTVLGPQHLRPQQILPQQR